MVSNPVLRRLAPEVPSLWEDHKQGGTGSAWNAGWYHCEGEARIVIESLELKLREAKKPAEELEHEVEVWEDQIEIISTEIWQYMMKVKDFTHLTPNEVKDAIDLINRIRNIASEALKRRNGITTT